MASEGERNDLIRQLFGDNIVSEYPDHQAISDGVLIPFLTPQARDTHHRITSNAWHELGEHYKEKGYANYSDKEFHDFFLNELLALAPEAYRVWHRQGILTTNYDFKVEKYDPGRSDQLWYIPNEVGGITAMRPDDY